MKETIAEEIIIPAIKDVIENVIKKDSQAVLRWIRLSENTEQIFCNDASMWLPMI